MRASALLDGPERLSAVPIDDAVSLRTGAPRALFRAARIVPNGAQGTGLFTLYDVSADGQRFIVNAVADDPPYSVVLNWTAATRR